MPEAFSFFDLEGFCNSHCLSQANLGTDSCRGMKCDRAQCRASARGALAGLNTFVFFILTTEFAFVFLHVIRVGTFSPFESVTLTILFGFV